MIPKFKDAFGFAPLIHVVLKGSRSWMAILLDHVNSIGGLFATPLTPVAFVSRAQIAYPTRERLQRSICAPACPFPFGFSHLSWEDAELPYLVPIPGLHPALATPG